jgi:pescadillo protein
MQMMKKKTKRLYDRMQHGLEKKQQAVQSLLTKRKALEEASPKPAKKAKQPAPAAGKKAAKKTKA